MKPRTPKFIDGVARNATQSKYPHLWDGLVGLWVPSAGVQGMELWDLSGNSNTGVMTNMGADDWIGEGLNFPDSTDYVKIPKGSGGETQVTMMAWVKPANFSGRSYVYFEGQSSVGFRFAMSTNYPSSQRVGFVARDGVTTLSFAGSTALVADEWQHMAVVFDANNDSHKVYLNGKEDGSSTTAMNAVTTTGGDLYVGLGNEITGLRFAYAGDLDDVRRYNRALSAQEIMESYTGASPLEMGGSKPSFKAPQIIIGNETVKPATPKFIEGIARNATQSQYPNLWDGLVGMWQPSAGVQGMELWDLSGNGNTGVMTNMNADDWASDSLEFDGSNDYVISDADKDLIGSTPSFSLWIKPTGAQGSKGIFQIASTLNSTNPWLLLQRTNSTSVKWYIVNSWRITQTVNDDEWTHIALTYDGTTWRSYLNGVAGPTYTGLLGPTAANNLYIGNGYNGYFNGQVDDIRLYNRTLSPQEVNQIYMGANPLQLAEAPSWGSVVASAVRRIFNIS